MDGDYINTRLIQWAQWAVQREDGGTGFPCECSYTRLAGNTGLGGFRSPDIDIEAMEIEAAVWELPEHLRATVREYYVEPGTIEQKVRSLRCGRQTLYDRIKVAQGRIAAWLDRRRKKSS